jgi:phage terminase large subunit-like protein
MPDFHRQDGITLTEEDVVDLLARYPQKFLWFAQKKYHPHYWQFLFHTNTNPETGRLCRFRHLVAGRRGGKTMSAAWEIVFYALHPEVFHQDLHGEQSSRPLVIWVVTQDYPIGLWAKLAIREALTTSGLQEGVDYKENRGHQWIEFSNGSFLLFKTADQPNKLRGAGVDIMWFDEAAVIVNEEAWLVSSPALANTLGMFISTTTPDGKNWFYNEFWSDIAKASPAQGRVEYWSIDNPYFTKEEWDRLSREYHPFKFKQEFMASFDAMEGRELSGSWLHYYPASELDQYRDSSGNLTGLTMYVAVDPAISLADTADRFSIAAIGVTPDRRQAYLVDQWAGRIPFPEQVDKINQWYHKYSPFGIGIEKTAYQMALVQQIQRLEGLPPVVPLWAPTKKSMRILAMAPFFRTGRIKISKDHVDFINEWVNYDSTKKNPQDDCLDSVEMALRLAGVVLPSQQRPEESPILTGAATTTDMWSDIAAKASARRKEQYQMDEHLGSEW